MSDSTILDFCAGPVMTEAAQSMQIKRGIARAIPDEFFTPSSNKSMIDQIKYKRFSGDRSLPPVIAHQSPSATQEVTGAEWLTGTAIGTKINFALTYDWIQAIRSGVPYLQQNAVDEFNRRMAEFNVKAETFRTTAIQMAVLTGHIYAAPDTTNTSIGMQLVSSSSGASIDIATGVTGPTILGATSNWSNTSIAVGDWSSASTDIAGSLRAARQGFIKTSGYKPATILYGEKIPSFLALNTSMQTFMSRNQQLGHEFQITNEVPSGLLDYNWVPAYNAYFKEYNGTLTTLLADNKIVIIPPVDDNWYELIDVGTMIPTGISGMVAGTAEAFLNQLVPAYGRFAYSTVQSFDPISLKAIVGDYMLPTLKTGLLQWIATVS